MHLSKEVCKACVNKHRKHADYIRFANGKTGSWPWDEHDETRWVERAQVECSSTKVNWTDLEPFVCDYWTEHVVCREC